MYGIDYAAFELGTGRHVDTHRMIRTDPRPGRHVTGRHAA